MIFNMSDREIVDDLKQQKMEKVVMQELQDSPVIIKKSGLFADIDKRFGEPVEGIPVTGGTEGGMPPTGGAPAPSSTGAPAIGGAPLGGAPTGGAPEGGIGGAAPIGGGEAAPLAEQMRKLTNEEYNKYVERLVYGSTKESEVKNEIRHKAIIQENNEIVNKFNKNAEQMINEIDFLLNKNETINTQQKINEGEDVNLEDLEEIDLS